MQNYRFCLKESRLVFQDAADGAQEVLEESSAVVLDEPKEDGGFRNTDGSYYDSANGKYVDSEGTAFSISPEAALKKKGDGATPFNAEVTEQPVDAPVEAKVAAQAEIQNDTKTELVEAKTKTQISELKMGVEELEAKMKDNFEVLAAAISLDGKDFSGKLTGMDATFELPEINAKTFIPEIAKLLYNNDRIKEHLEQLKAATEVEIQPDEADDALAVIYANSVAVRLRKAFKDKYDRAKEVIMYANARPGVKPLTLEFPYEVKFGKGADFDVIFHTEGNEFDKAYDEHCRLHDKPVEAPKPPDEKEQNLMARAKVLQDSVPGKVLAWMNLVVLEDAPKNEDGTLRTESEVEKADRLGRNQKAYASALSDNFFAKCVVWLMGGGHMLDGGGEDVVASLTDMGEKPAAAILALQKKVMASPLSLEKAALKVPRLDGSVAELLPTKKDDFGKMVKSEKALPESGVSLSEAYEFSGQKLSVDLKGGEMILPKGKFVKTADGNSQGDSDKDFPLKDKELVFIEPLPVGTVFKGKPVFKLSGSDEKVG